MDEINSEFALLGLLIKKPELLDYCQLISNFPQPFSGNHTNPIFRNIQKLYNTTGKVNSRELIKMGLPEIPFEVYQVIIKSAGFEVEVNTYVRDIYETMLKRKLTALGCSLANCHEDKVNTSEEYLLTVRNLISDIDSNSSITTGVSIAEAIQEICDKAEALNKGDGKHYIRTGVHAIDKIIMGLTVKTMSIWAARPSVGKTALAITAMSNMTLNKVSCGFVSVEMSEAEIIERIAQVRSGVSIYEFAERSMSQSRATGFYKELENISKCPYLQVERTTNRKISNIRSIIRKMKNNNPDLSVVFIDYIQKIQGDDRSQDMRMQVSEISSTLTDMTTDMNIHIAALAQLNRQGDEAPKLVHLKESGRIEEDAHYVFLIHRDLNKQHQGEDDGDAFVGVAKNRGGRTGNAQLKYNGKTTRFYDADAERFN